MAEDFRVQVKVTNNYLWQAIKAAGYDNVNQFCKAEGFDPGRVGEFMNMKAAPLGRDGDWIPTARRLSECLGPLPDELFPDSIPVLPSNATEFISSRDDIENLIESIDAKRIVGRLMASASLSKQAVQVLGQRSGDDEATLDEAGRSLGVSRERVRQIEAKGLRQLRLAAMKIRREDEETHRE